MTPGRGGHSSANVMHHLKGIHFPAQKRDLVQQAKQNGAEQQVADVINSMPDQEFASIADVMKAFGEAIPDAER